MFMLQFGPRLTFVAGTRLSIVNRFNRENNKPGNNAGFLTIVVAINPHRTTANKEL